MRRVVERRQDNPEDIEDSKWRRKSYALAQHNALPVPMPLPAYPPPKVVPLPTTAPARRPRAYRPPPPTYRPTNGTNRPLAPTPEVPAGMTRLPSHLPPTPEHPPPPEAGPTESLAATSAPAVPVRRRNAALQRQTASPSTPSSMDAEHLPPTPPLTSSSSSPPSPTSAASLSHLPPTPTSQVFPPTPSLSRSGTPTSLSCPRTPTSIRAAPWQPPFVEKSAASPTPSQTPPAGVGTAFPPTPSSTRSHTADNGVTPASSVSSLNNVMTESKPQAPPPTADRLEEVEPPLSLPAVEGPVGKTAVAPSILSAEHLHAQIKNVGGDSWRVGADAPPPAIPRDQDKKLPDEDEAKGAYKTYYTRFWILAVFSTLAFLQSTVWGTFGPILDSAEAAFGWTDATVAAFPNWGPVVVVTFTLPMMWFTQKLGLRLGMLACATLIFAGTLVRCFTSEPFIFTVLCHVGAVLNSFAACMTLSLPAMVAAVWFPPDERITATAVGALMCQLGGAAMYMGPLVVRSPGNGTSPEDTSETLAEDIRGDIMTLMYIHCGVAAALLLAVIIYFPARPPSPPSVTSAEDKPSFLSGIKSIAKNVQLLLVLGVYSFSFGVPVVWIGVLTFSLRVINIHQEQAMGVAVVAVCVSSVAAFVIARITDKMYGHLRVTIIGLLLASAACFLWFVLISTGVIEPSLVQVYMSVTGGVSFEYASVPLLVELAVELGYPIPESVTGAALTFLFNVVALVFLGLFQIPSDYMWVSYVLLACVSLTIIPLMFVKETHKRSEADRKEISHITGSASNTIA